MRCPERGRAQQSADGHLLAGATNDATFVKFCQALDIPHLAEDKRFQGPETRVENQRILIPILEECFATRSMFDCVKRFEEFLKQAREYDAAYQVNEDPRT